MSSPRPRRARIDSAANLHRNMANADMGLAPPPHITLRDDDWPFWRSILNELAGADWTSHQLEIAALLARNMAQLEQEQRLARSEGFVVGRANGDFAQNPRNRVVAALVGQVLAIRRSLALTGGAKAGGRSEDAAR